VSKQKAINILAVRVGDAPKVEQIRNTLKAFQTFVGGYVESVRVPGTDMVIFCNEDGRSLGLVANGSGLLGNYFLTKSDADGNMISLDPTDIAVGREFLVLTGRLPGHAQGGAS
jgi:hypothetical protein